MTTETNTQTAPPAAPPACRRCGVPIPQGRVFCSRLCGRFAPIKAVVKARAHHIRARKSLGDFCENPDCQSRARLQRHHIDGNEFNDAPENLRTLCDPCHRDWHRMVELERLQKIEDAQLKFRFEFRPR